MKKILSVLLFLTLQTTLASTTIPKLDHLGTLEFEMAGFYLVDKYKSISDFGPGKKKGIVSYDFFKANY